MDKPEFDLEREQREFQGMCLDLCNEVITPLVFRDELRNVVENCSDDLLQFIAKHLR